MPRPYTRRAGSKKIACDHCGTKFAPQGLSAHRRHLGLAPQTKVPVIVNGNHIEDELLDGELLEPKSLLDRISTILDSYSVAIENSEETLQSLRNGQKEIQAIQKSVQGN